ncbi:MAG: DMT family transporter [Oscillospiraceae bacterium]|nr:DMT family transporter [Oscillospiraceae bacterium]
MKKGVLYSLITAILFVTLEPVSKLIAGDVSPFAITFWRFMIGSLILIPPAVCKIKKENLHITAKDIGITTALGILFICISMTTLQIGVKKADSPALIAIIFSSNSIFTILFAMLILKEKLTRNKIIALVFGIIGVLICTDFSAGTNMESVLYGVFASLSFSLYTVLSRKFMTKLGASVQTSLVFVFGSIVLLLILLITGADLIPTFSITNLSNLAYLGLLVTGVGYACYFRAIEKGGVIMGSLAFFVKPVLTPFVTFFVNGIIPDYKLFIAIICIVVASYFTAYKKNA